MNLTERVERLVPGEPIELVWDTNQGIQMEQGRFERIDRDTFGDKALFYRHAGSCYDVPFSALRHVEPVDAAAIARIYGVGERVIVCRHRRKYRGTILKIAQTRLTVRITLDIGTRREHERDVLVCALDVCRTHG